MKKNFLVNKYKKQMCYKENKFLFFGAIENGLLHFQHDHRSLFSREMENIRTCREARLQKLNCQISSRFGICQVAQK